MGENGKKHKKHRLSAMTILLCMMIGIMLAMPFRIMNETVREPLPSESRQELINRMSKMAEENELLRTELEQSRQEIATLEENVIEGREASSDLSESISRYRILAGLDPVEGSGIRLTLSEQPTETAGNTSAPIDSLIHQEDLLNIVNELWLAGAEAIAIRSRGQIERLIMSSTIRCVGSLIDVNNTRMTPPFDIFAIGDPDKLEAAITIPGGVLYALRFYNIQFEIVKLDNVQLPAYGGSTLLQYAKPVQNQEGQ